jgi:ABC-type oligopeptide transport system ATPase subunit
MTRRMDRRSWQGRGKRGVPGTRATEDTAGDDETPSGEPLLSVRGLVKEYPIDRGVMFRRNLGVVRAVDGVAFDVHRGETFGIVGESGSGKSTTARLIARLLDPTAGEVRFDGRDITALRGSGLKRVRRDMQMVFQDPYSSLNPRRTVGAIIAEPLRIHRVRPAGSGMGAADVSRHGAAASGGVSRSARADAVGELLEMVGLNPEHRNRYPHEFSGGQRQRVGIARALALEPKLLIADEPVSALDVSIQAQVLNLLRDLQRRLGLTMVFISHDLSVIRHMCDRIAVMHDGRIVELASNEQLYAAPRDPYTRELLAAVPRARASGRRKVSV